MLGFKNTKKRFFVNIHIYPYHNTTNVDIASAALHTGMQFF